MDPRATKPKLLTQPQRGFTFIEVILAVSLLAVAASVIVGLQGAAVRRGLRDNYAQQAMLAARRIMAAIEANEETVQPFEQSGTVVELLNTFKVILSEDRDEAAMLEQLGARVRIESWPLPEVDPDAMRKVTLEVNWGSEPEDRLELVYFVPHDKREE